MLSEVEAEWVVVVTSMPPAENFVGTWIRTVDSTVRACALTTTPRKAAISMIILRQVFYRCVMKPPGLCLYICLYLVFSTFGLRNWVGTKPKICFEWLVTADGYVWELQSVRILYERVLPCTMVPAFRRMALRQLDARLLQWVHLHGPRSQTFTLGLAPLAPPRQPRRQRLQKRSCRLLRAQVGQSLKLGCIEIIALIAGKKFEFITSREINF